MIAENMIYFAIAVFILLIIGLGLTYLEFRYGNPRRQQKIADSQQKQSDNISTNAAPGPVQ